MAKLADVLRKWAAKPRRPGEGLHTDFFRAAILMLEAGYNDAQIYSFIRQAANMVKDRVVPDRELFGAIASAKARIAGGALEGQQWPQFSQVLRSEIIANGRVMLDDLAASGDQLPQEPAFYLQKIYRETDYVCVAPVSSKFTTKKRPEIEKIVTDSPHEYINPSAMVDEFGLTKDFDQATGQRKVSAHCLDNTGPKTWQVVEFDSGEVRDHVSLHWHLAQSAPLALLVYSGGKSLHGWYNVRGWNEYKISDFFGKAVQIGADPKMWSRCQFSRLPAGRNSKTGKTQMVLLFCEQHL